MILSDTQIAQYAIAAGWSGNDARIAVAVAIAESGGSTTAQNPSGASGLWQVMWSLHNESGDWSDPATNARAAYGVWKQQGWNAWTTYKRGTYLTYMGRAAIAVASAGTSASGASSNNNVPSDTSGASNTLTTAELGGTWLRVGAFFLGAMLMIAGLLRMMGVNQTVVQFAKGAAKDAVEAAAVA